MWANFLCSVVNWNSSSSQSLSVRLSIGFPIVSYPFDYMHVTAFETAWQVRPIKYNIILYPDITCFQQATHPKMKSSKDLNKIQIFLLNSPQNTCWVVCRIVNPSSFFSVSANFHLPISLLYLLTEPSLQSPPTLSSSVPQPFFTSLFLHIFL